jgi:hypothetical protein
VIFLFRTLDVMVLGFTFASLADFSVGERYNFYNVRFGGVGNCREKNWEKH